MKHAYPVDTHEERLMDRAQFRAAVEQLVESHPTLGATKWSEMWSREVVAVLVDRLCDAQERYDRSVPKGDYDRARAAEVALLAAVDKLRCHRCNHYATVLIDNVDLCCDDHAQGAAAFELPCAAEMRSAPWVKTG